jgi:3',5'-nucleoside bisphosphate phosphatase
MTPRPLADLHVHTTASDGVLTPAQVVREVVAAHLMAVAISDHDTIEGIDPAIEEAAKVGVIVVPAVEINTDFGKDEVHILGYYIDHRSSELRAHLEHQRRGRLERAERMVDRLNEIGVRISMARVLEIAGSGAIARPHIARAIVEAGYASNMNGAFGRYLIRGTAGYVPRSKLTPFQAIEIIRGSKGVAVFAHPGDSKHDEMIPQLVDAGLQGIEAYHTDHSFHQRRRYVKLAQQYGLIATGGSDSHGPGLMKDIAIGQVTVGIEVVDRLRELAGRT